MQRSVSQLLELAFERLRKGSRPMLNILQVYYTHQLRHLAWPTQKILHSFTKSPLPIFSWPCSSRPDWLTDWLTDWGPLEALQDRVSPAGPPGPRASRAQCRWLYQLLQRKFNHLGMSCNSIEEEETSCLVGIRQLYGWYIQPAYYVHNWSACIAKRWNVWAHNGGRREGKGEINRLQQTKGQLYPDQNGQS